MEDENESEPIESTESETIEDVNENETESNVDINSMTPQDRAEYLDDLDRQKEAKEPKEEKKSTVDKTKDRLETSKAIETKTEPSTESVKVKINGQEKEVSIDELKAHYQKLESANQKFAEASQLRKQSEQLINVLKSSPLEVLEKLGLDVDQIAEERLLKRLEFDSMSPEQQEAYLAKEKLRTYEQLEQERQAQEQYQKAEQLKTHYKQDFERQIIQAIEENELPRDSNTAKKIIDYMSRVIQNKIPLTIQDIIPMVKEDLAREEREFLDRYKKRDLDTLLAHLGDDTVKAIQKKAVEKLKNPYSQNQIGKSVNTSTTSSKSKSEKGSLDKWRTQMLNEMYGS